MILKNKKGDEKYMSIWWFFVLTLIGGGLVIGVTLFSSSDVDTKQIEADILITRLVDCVVQNGYLNNDFISDKLDIFDSCKIDRTILDSGIYSLYYKLAKVEACSIDKGVKCSSYLFEKSYGVENFKILCSLNGKNYPKCSEKYIYLMDENKQKYVFYVISGSNQKMKNEVSA